MILVNEMKNICLILIFVSFFLHCLAERKPPPPFKTVQFGNKKHLELFVRVGDTSCPYYEQQSDPQIALFHDKNGNCTIGQNKLRSRLAEENMNCHFDDLFNFQYVMHSEGKWTDLITGHQVNINVIDLRACASYNGISIVESPFTYSTNTNDCINQIMKDYAGFTDFVFISQSQLEESDEKQARSRYQINFTTNFITATFITAFVTNFITTHITILHFLILRLLSFLAH